MEKPTPQEPQEGEQPAADLPDESPSFEDLLLLVFNGPMCFECLEGEDEGDEEPDQSKEDEGVPAA